MRLLLLSALLGASLSALAARPPGYRAPHRYLTPSNQPYHRQPLRVNFGLNTTYYNGDVASSSAGNTYKIGYGIGLAQTLSPRLTLAIDLSSVRMAAKDAFPERGFSFSSRNTLLTGLLRYNIFADKSLLIGPEHKEMPVLLFVSAGVGALRYDPSPGQYGFPLAPEAGYTTFTGLAAVLPVGAASRCARLHTWPLRPRRCISSPAAICSMASASAAIPILRTALPRLPLK
ncbi:hypothetical protein [Hymenobacter sp. BRD67]|uniref:hypothetical protein n=1 Tax=Hymenobacter sp. BRD67 TaxID=2675877 RepID=UPI00156340E1|nr:hypothetical protein [Hymenobacter sp. BRD67]QKG53809.1 hypothetical protein GKZ67_15905 [Hymenobacter sp. BRD67]